MREAASGQSVETTTIAISRARIADAIAAGNAWVWNTSAPGPAFVWVSMIANRTRTLIAPMYTSTWAAATTVAPASTYSPASAAKHTIIARPQRMMSFIVTTSRAAPIMTPARLMNSRSSHPNPRNGIVSGSVTRPSQ